VVDCDLCPDSRSHFVEWWPRLAFRHSRRRRAEQLAALVCVRLASLFFFYAIAIIPFSVMAVALCAGMDLGDARAGDRRMVAAIVIWGVRCPGRSQLCLYLSNPQRRAAALPQVAVADVVQKLDLI
jgi:hypothetical protein